MADRLSDADLAALESVDEPLRVTAIRDLVADLRAARAEMARLRDLLADWLRLVESGALMVRPGLTSKRPAEMFVASRAALNE